MQRIQKAQDEVKDCNFRPQIDRNSKQMVNMSRAFRSHSVDKFTDLYEDAKRRQERKENLYSNCLEQECTFEPDISVTRIHGRRHSEQRPSNRNQIFNRLYHERSLYSSRERTKMCLDNSISLSKDLRDPETG